MDEQELIQVNLRLPASALDGLSLLAEQLRKLAAAVNGLRQPAGAPEEIVESGFFDPERFQVLRQKSENAVRRSPGAEARSVRSEVTDHVQDPDRAGQELAEGRDLPEREEPLLREEGERPEIPVRTADSARELPAEDIPAVHVEVESTSLDAPVVRAEPESRIPEADEVRVQAGEAETPLPPAQTDVSTGAETPVGAGLVVTAQPEPPVSRWTGVTEELVTEGPAPLTAEAVSLAFQRDGRRYDNGFPLY